ncbi:MAG: hypothetical protein QM736_04550 [Vicinamibacterales bacterium]
MEFVFHLFRGLGRTDLESTVTLVQRGLLAVAAGVALWWRPTLATLAIAMILPGVVACIIVLRLARNLVGGYASNARTSMRVGTFVHAIAPVGAGLVLSALYFRVDILLLEHWRGAGEAGTYNAVFRLVEAMRLAPAAVVAVMLPTLCRAADLACREPAVRAPGHGRSARRIPLLAVRHSDRVHAVRRRVRGSQLRVQDAVDCLSTDVVELRAHHAVARMAWAPRLGAHLSRGAHPEHRDEQHVDSSSGCGRRRPRDGVDRGRRAGRLHDRSAPAPVTATSDVRDTCRRGSHDVAARQCAVSWWSARARRNRHRAQRVVCRAVRLSAHTEPAAADTSGFVADAE